MKTQLHTLTRYKRQKKRREATNPLWAGTVPYEAANLSFHSIGIKWRMEGESQFNRQLPGKTAMVNKVCFSRLNDLVVELQYQASSLFSGVSLRKTGNGLHTCHVCTCL